MGLQVSAGAPRAAQRRAAACDSRSVKVAEARGEVELHRRNKEAVERQLTELREQVVWLDSEAAEHSLWQRVANADDTVAMAEVEAAANAQRELQRERVQCGGSAPPGAVANIPRAAEERDDAAQRMQSVTDRAAEESELCSAGRATGGRQRRCRASSPPRTSVSRAWKLTTSPRRGRWRTCWRRCSRRRSSSRRGQCAPRRRRRRRGGTWGGRWPEAALGELSSRNAELESCAPLLSACCVACAVQGAAEGPWWLQ